MLLLSNLTSNAINRFERKSGRGATRAGKGLTLFISNKDMNDIIKITKSLVDPNVLIDGITETVKHKIKKRRRIFWRFFRTISRVISATSDFFSSKRYKWKKT